MAIHKVTTSAGLVAAYAAARDGDRIELAAGDYGAVKLTGRSFDTGIVITSADPDDRAVMNETIWITNSQGVTLTGIDILARGLAPDNDYARMAVKGSRDITISDITIDGHVPTEAEGARPEAKSTKRLDAIAGYGYDRGLQIGDSENVHVSNVEMRDLRIAIGLNGSTKVVLENMDIHRVREGINMHDVVGVEIADSHFHDFKPWWFGNPKVNDHPDMIQYWGDGSKVGVHDVSIHDNLFEQGADDGWTQTIFGHIQNPANPGVTATGFDVRDNIIVNGQLNAISIANVTGSVITGNLLLPKADLDNNPAQGKTPGIVLMYPQDAVVSDNTFLAFTAARPIRASGQDLADGVIAYDDSNVLLSTNPGDPLYWRNFLDDRVVVTTDAGKIRASVTDHMADTKGVGIAGLSYDGSTLDVTGDGWKALEMNIEITADTVLSFDFMADRLGEIHAIGFANGNTISQKHVFELLGTDTFGIQAHYGLYRAGQVDRHYEIRVGDYFTGSFDRLVLIADDDRGKDGDSTFANIALTGAKVSAATVGGLLVNGQSWKVMDHLAASQGTGNHALSAGGSMLSVTDNAWKAVAMDIDITADTVLSFDFFATVRGEIHGIGFANGDKLDPGAIFKLLGTQQLGIGDYDGFSKAGRGAQHYDIAVGKYFTGTFDRLVFVMDDDARKGADSNFSNIEITGTQLAGGQKGGNSDLPGTGAPLADGLLQIGTDRVAVLDGRVGTQDKGVAKVSDDGSAVTVTRNGWKVADMAVEIDEDTVLSFDFSSEKRGEIHGIGFSNGDEVPETYFQIAGTQRGGIAVDAKYVAGSGFQHYEIAVGEHFTGTFDQIVFIMDQDKGSGADSTFANIDIL